MQDNLFPVVEQGAPSRHFGSIITSSSFELKLQPNQILDKIFFKYFGLPEHILESGPDLDYVGLRVSVILGALFYLLAEIVRELCCRD